MYGILHNIRSAHNVGSIFRTADGAGVEKLYLTGYTPAPVDRFGRDVSEIAKTALGATESVAWEQRDDIFALISELKDAGVKVVAIEQHARAEPLDAYTPTAPSAYIFGNETEGLPEGVCAEADAVVHVPMRGTKESLNVAVCTGIVLFALR